MCFCLIPGTDDLVKKSSQVKSTDDLVNMVSDSEISIISQGVGGGGLVDEQSL